MLSLTDLPTEVLVAICSSLCLHCQLPRVVDAPHDIVATASTGQQALARLSQCSAKLRRVAQPVLFHWYHSHPQDGYHAERRRSTAFLFAIIRQPDLAAAVRALSLHAAPFPLDTSHADDISQSVHDKEGLCRRAAQRVGGHLLRACPSSGLPHLEFIQELAVVITPQLSQLCLNRKTEWSRSEEWCWTGWSYDMPTLKDLVFEGVQGDPDYEVSYHIYQAKNLLRHTPNLQILIAPDCAAGADGGVNVRYRSKPWDIPLEGLTTLSLNGSDMEQMATILRECPLLEDLEYYDGEDTPAEALDPERHLGHIKTTLRRLCYSMRRAGPKKLEEDDDIIDARMNDDLDIQSIIRFCDWFGGLTRMDTVGLSFSSFPVLDVLELEQAVLYGPIFPTDEEPAEDRSSMLSTPGEFLDKLPPSIRLLRVGSVFYWPTLYRDLMALAVQSSRFPRLKIIRLDVFRASAPPEEELQALVGAFRAAADIKLSLYQVTRAIGSRGLLPARPGHKQPVLKPLPYSFD